MLTFFLETVLIRRNDSGDAREGVDFLKSHALHWYRGWGNQVGLERLTPQQGGTRTRAAQSPAASWGLLTDRKSTKSMWWVGRWGGQASFRRSADSRIPPHPCTPPPTPPPKKTDWHKVNWLPEPQPLHRGQGEDLVLHGKLTTRTLINMT